MNPLRKLPLLFLVMFCVASTMSCRTNQNNPSTNVEDSKLSALANSNYLFKVLTLEGTDQFVFATCQVSSGVGNSKAFQSSLEYFPCVNAYAKEDGTGVTFPLASLEESRDDAYMTYHRTREDFLERHNIDVANPDRKRRTELLHQGLWLGFTATSVSGVAAASAAYLGAPLPVSVGALALSSGFLLFAASQSLRATLIKNSQPRRQQEYYQAYIQEKMDECKQLVNEGSLDEASALRCKMYNLNIPDLPAYIGLSTYQKLFDEKTHDYRDSQNGKEDKLKNVVTSLGRVLKTANFGGTGAEIAQQCLARQYPGQKSNQIENSSHAYCEPISSDWPLNTL